MTADPQTPVEELVAKGERPPRREDRLRTSLEKTRLAPEMLHGCSATKAEIRRIEQRFLAALRAVRDE